MKRTKLIFAVLAAVLGIGGAYASQPKVQTSADQVRWHTVNGSFVVTAYTATAQLRCVGGHDKKCLIGTIAGQFHATLFGTFQK